MKYKDSIVLSKNSAGTVHMGTCGPISIIVISQ